MTATRRLAAILAADVAGYSRLIGADEGGTLQALKAIRAELIDPTIAEHRGRLVKTTGARAQCPTEIGTSRGNPHRSRVTRPSFRRRLMSLA